MKTKRTLSYLLTITTLISTIVPSFAYKDSISNEEYHDVEIVTDANNTTVYAEVGSSFKVTIPKHIILDGTTKSGVYTIDVSGDIAGNEVIMVVPDEYFRLSSINKLDIYAYIDQDRVSWTYKDMNVISNGLIETENMTAGSWNGNFNFNIKLESSGELVTNATNSNGEEVKVIVNNIAGVQKEQLLGALVQSGQVSSNDDVDTLLNIDNIENVDNVEIDTSDVANPGDTVVIVQEKENEWDYVSTETVNSNNKVFLSAANKKPVSFVQTQPDGTIHVHTYEEEVANAATCETDGTLLMNCECDKSYSFSIPASHELKVVEKKDENGELINKYYECNNCTYSILNLTKLFSGDELSHDCNDYLVSKYDELYHWNECNVCNTKQNSTTHTYSTYWTHGDTCAPTNKLIHTCTCGYSYNTNNTRSHASGFWYNNNSQHNWACSKCRTLLGTSGRHKNSSGQILGCDTGKSGSCSTCGQSIVTTHSGDFTYNENELAFTSYRGCFSNCGYNGININSSNCTISRNGNYFTIKAIIYGNANITSGGNCSVVQSGTCVIDSSNYSISGKSITYNINGHFNTGYNVGVYSISMPIKIGNNSYSCYIALSPDKKNPTIDNITQTNDKILNDWTINKQLSFTGTENYCDSITITLKDDMENIYLNNIPVNVNSNNKWSYSNYLDIEANENKTFILIATDTLGNTTSKTFTVSKTDRKPPTPSINTTTSIEWSKTKEMLFSAVDEGSGNVQIAFNNINEYVSMSKNNTLYTKTYQFSGDVYGEVTAAIYYKDAVGNVATQFIKVHNLDNTAPTILNVDRNENILTISANDLNKELGLEGSGIDSYAITWTLAPPQESDWQESNTFEITKGGTYYLWVRDAVGNISDSYKIKVLL